MAKPFRLRVLKALAETVKKVAPTHVRGGDGLPFENDLTDYVDAAGVQRPRVFRGRDLFGPSDPLPLVSILEHPRAAEQLMSSGANTTATGEWELLIQGFVEDDPEHPTDPAHVLAAEVISVIAAERHNRYSLFGLGNREPCVTDIRIGAPVVRPADDTISTTAFFALSVTLTLVEDLAAPFA